MKKCSNMHLFEIRPTRKCFPSAAMSYRKTAHKFCLTESSATFEVHGVLLGPGLAAAREKDYFWKREFFFLGGDGG